MTDTSPKTCFVICPIGEPGTDIRQWSDDIFHHFIQPIAAKFGYAARRAIDEPRPGEITTAIIDDVVNADLVVADLTFHNANVFYELALRHAQGKPFFHVAEKGTRIPFDVSNINTVFIERSTFEAIDRTRGLLERHFEQVKGGTASFANPVTRHQEKLNAERSENPIEQRLVALEELVDGLASAKGEAPAGQGATFQRFERQNRQFLQKLNSEIFELLIGRRYELVFNPSAGAKKAITFNFNGSIGEGQNHNEATWRVVDGKLEILNHEGRTFSRFIYVPSTNSFQHTNDPDTLSIKGQTIVPI